MKIRYYTSLLLFFLKGEISFDQNFVNFNMPNTILAIIPFGCEKVSVPINQIASIKSSFSIKFFRFIAGLAMLAFAQYISSEHPFPAILLIIEGINATITSFERYIALGVTSGKSKFIDFLIFDKKKADLAEQHIRQLIANRMNETTRSKHDLELLKD